MYNYVPPASKFKELIGVYKGSSYYKHLELMVMAYEGGPAWNADERRTRVFPNTTRLFPHRLESNADYARRQSRAHYKNYCRPIIRILVTHIWNQGVRRKITGDEALFEKLSQSINAGSNLNLDRFWRSVAGSGIGYGATAVEVVSPSVPEGATRAQSAELYPTLRSISPLHIIHAQTHPTTGAVEEALIEDVHNTSYGGKPATRYTYRMFTENAIEEESIIKVAGGEVIYVAPRTYPTRNGVMPLVFVAPYSETDVRGEALLQDLAPINRTVFNMDSLHDDILYQQTFGQLTVPAADDKVDLKATGVNRAFTFPLDARHPPAFISPPQQNVAAFEARVTGLRLEMYRIALLGPSGGAVNMQYATATGREHDWSDTKSVLGDYAALMQGAEAATARKLGEVMGEEPLYVPTYPSDFSIRTLEANLRNALDLKIIGNTTLLTAALEQVTRSMMSNLEPQELDTLVAEIQAEQKRNAEAEAAAAKFLMEPRGGGDTDNDEDEDKE